MSEQPKRAKQVRLSEVTELIQYGYTAQSSPVNTGAKYLRITDIQNDQVDWTQVPHASIEKDDRDRYALQPGDIVFARTGATVGKSFLIRSSPPDSAVFASYLIRVRCKKDVLDPEYAAFFFKSEEYWRQISQGAAGTGQPNFNGTKLGNLSVPLWPLNQQRRIVARLDNLFKRSKSAREELARIPRLVERYKQAILAAAFRGNLTTDWRRQHADSSPIGYGGKDHQSKMGDNFEPPYAIPATWRWLSLPEMGVLDRGKSRHRPRNAPELYGGPYPFVQTGDIRAASGRVMTFDKTYNEAGLAQSRLWPKGTVCITIAANIAETAILGIDACFPDSIVGFQANPERCEPHFIEFFIRTVKEELEAFAPATAQKNINLETLRMVNVPCPPLNEQREIIQRVEISFRRVDQVMAEATRASELLDRLDQATLAKAFRGELFDKAD